MDVNYNQNESEVGCGGDLALVAERWQMESEDECRADRRFAAWKRSEDMPRLARTLRLPLPWD